MSSPQAPAEGPEPGCTAARADREIDVTAELCPMTYVRTRLALDRLAPGELLGVTVKGEEAARNVPQTARLQGHAVLEEAPGEDGTLRVLIRKKS